MGKEKSGWRGEGIVVKGGFLGAAVSICAGVILCGILALLISNESISETSIGYGTLVVLLLSSAAGALIAIKTGGSRTMILALISALIYFLFLLLLTAIFFGGRYDGVGATAAVIACGAVCTAILSAGVGRKAQKGRKRRNNR